MMPEQHSAEVEKALLSIGDARDCTEAAGERLARAGAEGQVIDALRDAERDLTVAAHAAHPAYVLRQRCGVAGPVER